MKVKVIPCGPAVNDSERKAINHLKTRLISEPGKDEWLLLTNLAFSATPRRQSDEIDIVAIGPPGVRIIEVKHWTAIWIDQERDLVEQEAERVTRKARRIGTTLRDQVANLPWVDGVFLVTEAAAEVRGLDSAEPVRGIPFHTLKTWHLALGCRSPSVLSPQKIKRLGEYLEPRSSVTIDGSLKSLAGYTCFELLTPHDQQFHRTYKATHASRREQVILHLYDLSASEFPHAADRAEREWKSLQRLQQYSWAPRIVDSFQDALGYPGEIKFFTIADFSAPGIDKRARDTSWDSVARLTFAKNAVRALSDLHETIVGNEHMVHRNLTPSNILVKHDNSPILTEFEYTRNSKYTSVSYPLTESEWDASVAPEVREQGRDAADYRSDIYSLCSSLSVLFIDRNDKKRIQAKNLLSKGMEPDPKKRGNLKDLEASLSSLLDECSEEPHLPPARFWTEDQIVVFQGKRYRIVSRLGSESVSSTFKVVKVDQKSDDVLGTYIAKVSQDKETAQRILRSYELAHSHLHRSTALSTIFDVATEWQANSFIALLSWTDGKPLSAYSGRLPLLAHDLQEVSTESLACRWLMIACEALKVLHDSGLVHGDISPCNMIVSNAKLVLIDYDFVAKIGEPATALGSIVYSSPPSSRNGKVMPSDDFYALAASFFHVVFEKEPFKYGDIQEKERGLNWDEVKREQYRLLANFLDRATDPNPGKRFSSATEAMEALRFPETPIKFTDELGSRQERHVDRLMSLLQSYPGSPWGNSETRGLDSPLASDTYVETNLDRVLRDDITKRRVQLVILCGNAGDGKTALLQHLAKQLNLSVPKSATRILEERLEDGLVVRMNFDGSASWHGHSANDLLDDFFEPFHAGSTTLDIARLLAVNDGRLLEWIEHIEASRGGPTLLTKNLFAFLGEEDLECQPPPHIRFFNLNQRSLVGNISTVTGHEIDNSFLDRLVDQLYGGSQAATIWKPCGSCSAQERCEVFRAAKHFGPGTISQTSVRNRARERLFEALQAVHVRGETHITIRELRATLVYILFGIHYCSDYHSTASLRHMSPPEPYWDRAFSPNSAKRQGDVLQELLRFDPALEAQPKLDRYLLHSAARNSTFASKSDTLKSRRRRAYFELSEDEVRNITNDANTFGLAQGQHLLEFRNLAVEGQDNNRHELIKKLCRGISRLTSLPPQAFDRNDTVPLRITPRTPTETDLWVEKPLRNFQLTVEPPTGYHGLDSLPRQALLTYRYHHGCEDNEEHLYITGDLFHLLMELNDGYQLGDVATDDTFAHLSVFVQRLIQENDRRILAWNPMQEGKIYEISAFIDRTHSDNRQRIKIAPLELSGGLQ